MAVDFAKKLRITARALGCVTQKDLCARFYDVNPKTQFQLTNSYKWFSGRAQPRSSSVFEDWARLLDLGKSGAFLADCPFEEFRQLVSERYPVAGEEAIALPDGATAFTYTNLLQGHYAIYSLAWSKATRGSIIRGSLGVEAGPEGALLCRYEEQVPGGSLRYRGRVLVAHRALHFILEDSEHQSSLFWSCHIPAPPANVLAGLMAGSAYHDPESRPMAGRLLCLRQLVDGPEPSSPNRYLDGDKDELARDIEALGYGLPAELDIGALCLDYLRPTGGGDLMEVPLVEVDSLIMTFDRHLLTRTA